MALLVFLVVTLSLRFIALVAQSSDPLADMSGTQDYKGPRQSLGHQCMSCGRHSARISCFCSLVRITCVEDCETRVASD